MFIVIEGGDASGKTTIINKIQQKLSVNQIGPLDSVNTVILKSPTSPFSDIWKDIEENPNIDTLTRFYFFRTAVQHDVNTVKHLLSNNFNVILERYIYSTEAFNMTLDEIKGVNNPDLLSKEHVNYKGILKPDLAFLLDISDEERNRRIFQRAKEKKKLSWWERPDFQHGLNEKLRIISRREGLIRLDNENNSIDDVLSIITQTIQEKSKNSQIASIIKSLQNLRDN